MAQSGTMPMGHLVDMIGVAREADLERVEPVRVGVMVDAQCDRALVLAVRDALLPVHEGATLSISLLSDGAEATRASTWDLGIVIAGGSDAQVVRAVRTLAGQGVPVAVVAESALDAPDAGLSEAQAQLMAVVAASDAREVVRGLARWLVTATPKGTALAANFPFCRKARVDELVRSYAAKNAAAGAMSKSEGESSSLSSSQARLYMQIAAAYGRAPSLGRALELSGVLWAGYGYGVITRSALGIIPGSGWALRAGVGYLGTWMTAKAVATYFDRQDAGEAVIPTPKVVEAAGNAVRAAWANRRRRAGAALSDALVPLRGATS